MSEILAFQAVVFVCGTIAFVTTLGFVRRYLELRHERRPLPDAELSTRLARIEHTMDAMAIEVERISEGNRFVAKLLDRTGVPVPSAAPPRVITPH